MNKRLEEIRENLAEAERVGSPELTYYGYVKYEDVIWLIAEIDRLKALGRELCELSWQMGWDEYLSVDELKRYWELGKAFDAKDRL